MEKIEKYKIIQEALIKLERKISDYEQDFRNDFKRINLDGDLGYTSYILPRDIQYVCSKMNGIISSIAIIFKKEGFDFKKNLTYSYEADYRELFNSYNKIFSSFFNSESKSIWERYENEKIKTPTGLPWGIITSSTADYIAYAVLDTFHSMSIESKILNKYTRQERELYNHLENKWAEQFDSNFMVAFYKCNKTAREEIISHIMEVTKVDAEEYFTWERSNPFQEKIKLDVRKNKLNEVKKELDQVKEELALCKKPILGVFGSDKQKYNDLKQRIMKHEIDIRNLSNNTVIPNIEFALGEINENFKKNADRLNSKSYYREAILDIEFDENRGVYAVLDEEIGEIGTLKPEFTTQYGSFRSLKGSNHNTRGGGTFTVPELYTWRTMESQEGRVVWQYFASCITIHEEL